MSRPILSDITEEFKSEVPECGNASKCYCYECTEKRGSTFILFAAWRQVVRNKKDTVPIKKSFELIENKYASSHLIYNVVVAKVQEVANCNGLYAADLTALIITYTNSPTAIVVANEYLNGTLLYPEFVGSARVLTYWYDFQIELELPVNHRWFYMNRKDLFKIFTNSYENAKKFEIHQAFDKLRKSVPMLSGGKFKNSLYILSPIRVIINGTETVELNIKVDENLTIGQWPEYLKYFETLH